MRSLAILPDWVQEKRGSYTLTGLDKAVTVRFYAWYTSRYEDRYINWTVWTARCYRLYRKHRVYWLCRDCGTPEQAAAACLCRLVELLWAEPGL